VEPDRRPTKSGRRRSLVSFGIEYTALYKSIQLASSFSTFKTIISLSLSSPIVVRKKVLTFLRDEKNRSFVAVEIGRVFKIEIIFEVSEKAAGSCDKEEDTIESKLS